MRLIAASHTRTFSKTELHLVLCLYAIAYYNVYLEHDACNPRTSIKLNRFCVCGQKMCELAANGKDREWGRGGSATCVCNANEHGPPQLFLRCCAYVWHTLHLHGFSPLWMLLCVLKIPARENRLLQTEHSNGFSPKWTLMCSVNCWLFLQYFPHSVHLYFPACIFICSFKTSLHAKRSSHTVHAWGLGLSTFGRSVVSTVTHNGHYFWVKTRFWINTHFPVKTLFWVKLKFKFVMLKNKHALKYSLLRSCGCYE